MIQALRELVAIQDLDTELAAVEKEAAALPELRARAEAEREQARAELAAAQEALEQAELEERRLERELREQEALIQRLEAQTYEVKSSEAYRTLQSEIEHTREAVSDGETRILETLVAIDQARGQLDRAKEREVETRGAGDPDLAEREARIEGERARLRGLRAERAAAVERDLLLRYQTIAERRSPAVAVVSGKACPNCRMAIQPQKLVELGAAHSVVTCESCGRILVSRRALEEAPGSGSVG